MVEFLGLVLFSPYRGIALFFFLLSLAGIFTSLRKEPWTALVLVTFPALLFVSMSRQCDMVVRNCLPIAPALAVFSAGGLFWLMRLLKHPGLRMSLGLCTILALGTNAVWLEQAGRTIEDNSADRWVRQAADYIRSQPRVPIFLSEQVRSQLQSTGEANLANIVSDPKRSSVVLLYAEEGFPDWIDWPGDPSKCWPANRPALLLTWFGSYHCNLNCYPTYYRPGTIVAMATSQAFAAGVRPVVAPLSPVPPPSATAGRH